VCVGALQYGSPLPLCSAALGAGHRTAPLYSAPHQLMLGPRRCRRPELPERLAYLLDWMQQAWPDTSIILLAPLPSKFPRHTVVDKMWAQVAAQHGAVQVCGPGGDAAGPGVGLLPAWVVAAGAA